MSTRSLPTSPRTPLSLRLVLQILAVLLAALYVIPALFVITMSLRPVSDVFAHPGQILPDSWRWQNYIDAVQSASFGLYFVNSTIVAVISTAAQVILACLAGYALARIPFKGRDALFLLVIATLIVPHEVTLVPLFIMLKNVPLAGGNNLFSQGGIGWLNSYPGLITPHLVSPLSIFLMRQFFLSLPEELADAVRIDGGSDWTILWRIFTPLAKPAVATVAIFAFQDTWNDFLWPLVITKTDQMKTLQLGLTIFYQENSTQWPLLMAGIIMVSLPIIVLFLFGQRTFTAGISAGALKG